MTEIEEDINQLLNAIFASVFDKYAYGGIAGRVRRELKQIMELNLCDRDSISFTCEIDNLSNEHLYKLKLRNIMDRRWYEFILSPHYPFRPPKLRVNECDYGSYLKMSSIEFGNALERYTGHKCLCCSSMLCHSNWAPIMLLKQVFTEVKFYHNLCRKVAIHVIVGVIKRKYLIDDINLLEWLY